MAKPQPVKNPRKSKREDILAAALRVFCHYGFDGATLDKIAAEAGVSKSLVVKFYGTQKEMLVLCLQNYLDEMLGKMQKNAEKKGNTLEAHLDYVFELYKMSRAQMRLLLTTFLTPAHEEMNREIMPGYIANVHGMLANFSDSVDPALFPQLVYVVYSLLIAYIIGGNEENYKQALREALKPFQGHTGDDIPTA